jgi:hypothetical protein
MHPFHADSSQNYGFCLEEENYINITSDPSLKVQFPRKSYIKLALEGSCLSSAGKL